MEMVKGTMDGKGIKETLDGNGKGNQGWKW